ncbi:MAG: DinB family protein [Phycisphaerales bacterium]
MTASIGSMISDAHNLCVGYANMLCNDIPADQFTRRHAPTMNHPAFCMGHLSLYHGYAMGMAGLGDHASASPDGWDDMFNYHATCDDDTGQYPSKDEILARYLQGAKEVTEHLASADDALLSAAIDPESPLASRVNTNGAAVMFLLSAHPMVHLGQISTWRRAAGMGSAM